MEQLRLFPEQSSDLRPPESVGWNLWHGCTKVSAGCKNCYVYRRDESVGRDPTKVEKTQNFNLPVRILRSGEYKGEYKVPGGSRIDTCFSSDFFHPAADEWRSDAWDIIRTRADCTFFMITKRPERIYDHLPPDWGSGWEHVTIAVTCENAEMAEKRLPIYLSLPLRRHAVMVEPMLSAVDLRPYFRAYPGVIRLVSAGGESGPNARVCDFAWVRDLHDQCAENGAAFSYHQTGARLIKDGKEYRIPRRLQHSQARKAGLALSGSDGIE
ncbi:MAG: DUF5131 family protein [Clostridia bacterium]|nr:DUF5131 family protein [Clostridia bacterium]